MIFKEESQLMQNIKLGHLYTLCSGQLSYKVYF